MARSNGHLDDAVSSAMCCWAMLVLLGCAGALLGFIGQAYGQRSACGKTFRKIVGSVRRVKLEQTLVAYARAGLGPVFIRAHRFLAHVQLAMAVDWTGAWTVNVGALRTLVVLEDAPCLATGLRTERP